MAKKAKKTHPADQADLDAIKTAIYFNVHLRKSPTSKINERADTLAEAVAIADRIRSENPHRNVLVFAITPKDQTVPVPQAMQAAARAGDFDIAPAKPTKSRSAGKRANVEAKAKAGKLPTPPDFSAETHKPYRKRLAGVVAMVEAGDLDGLKALDIKTYSSSPKAIERYRNLAVIALESRG